MNLSENFFDLMDKGGPVMWVILVVAWVAIIMVVERVLRIARWRRLAVVDQSKFDQDPAYSPQPVSDRRASPIATIIGKLNWTQIHSKEELAEHLNIHLAELMPRLEGSLPTIANIGSLLPMLGLLGTVTGMIEVFQSIAVHGTGDPQQMANGISEALLTTASGLIIAIPVIFTHHLLVRQLRFIIATTEQSMHALYSRGVLKGQDENG